MLGSKVKRMVGISVPVPSVDDGAIVAALHIVWALRGRAATCVECGAFGRTSNVVLAGGRECSEWLHSETELEYIIKCTLWNKISFAFPGHTHSRTVELRAET